MSECSIPTPDTNTRTCPSVGSQTATVCLPVSVSPYAVAGPAVIHCCGKAEVTHDGERCHGDEHCHGRVNGTCDFIITQTIKIDVPVEFGAKVKVGDTFVECGRPKEEADENPMD